MKYSKEDHKELLRSLPNAPIVFTTPSIFKYLLSTLHYDELCKIELYLTKMNRPVYQEIFCQFMKKKYDTYIQPTAFSRKRTHIHKIADKLAIQASCVEKGHAAGISFSFNMN